jgi:hypothetical protein
VLQRKLVEIAADKKVVKAVGQLLAMLKWYRKAAGKC